jgi:hypothetical protein
MEIVRTRAPRRQPDRFDQVVFYLLGSDAVRTATEPLRKAGLLPYHAPHPLLGGERLRDVTSTRTVAGVVYAPWVYGRDPDPVDGPSSTVTAAAWSGSSRMSVPGRISGRCSSWPRTRPAQLDSYLGSGRVLVARSRRFCGRSTLQLVETDR